MFASYTMCHTHVAFFVAIFWDGGFFIAEAHIHTITQLINLHCIKKNVMCRLTILNFVVPKQSNHRSFLVFLFRLPYNSFLIHCSFAIETYNCWIHIPNLAFFSTFHHSFTVSMHVYTVIRFLSFFCFSILPLFLHCIWYAQTRAVIYSLLLFFCRKKTGEIKLRRNYCTRICSVHHVLPSIKMNSMFYLDLLIPNQCVCVSVSAVYLK